MNNLEIMFEKVSWLKDKVVFNDYEFFLQVYSGDDIRKKKDAFVFYKDKKLIDMYQRFFD